jgi:hypothetical protein
MSTSSSSNSEFTLDAVLDCRGVAFRSGQQSGRATFQDAWNAFAMAARQTTGSSGFQENIKGYKQAWADCFKPVFYVVPKESTNELDCPIEFREYTTERQFSDSLFTALRASLGGLCGPTIKSNEIHLKDSNVRFATDIGRNVRLGLGRNDGRSHDGKADHACLVTGDDGIDDATTVVQLQLSSSACMVPNENGNGLRYSLGPLGRGVGCGFETLGCLTRRGHSATFVTVLSLAAKKQGHLAYANHLCCVECNLQIPERLGDRFGFKVLRRDQFPLENNDEALSIYQEATAVYLKTMCIGLQQANVIRTNMRDSKPAVSLCCSTTAPGFTLLASPIPRVRCPTDINISQGELYKFAGSNDCFHSEIVDRPGSESFYFRSRLANFDGCIVKVCCPTVHKFLVHPDTTCRAFRYLARAPQKLKAQIAKVLVACFYVSMRCLVTVMTDLSSDGLLANKASTVSPDAFDSPPILWVAFSDLARKLLLPMAKMDVVHLDIRFDPKSWSLCNILCVKNSKGQIELRLIDYESLVLCNAGNENHTWQKYAIPIDCLGADGPSGGLTFLFWQVLWVAYVCCPATRRENLVEARDFVQKLFVVDSFLLLFKAKIGTNGMYELANIHNGGVSDSGIIRVLRVLGNAFT